MLKTEVVVVEGPEEELRQARELRDPHHEGTESGRDALDEVARLVDDLEPFAVFVRDFKWEKTPPLSTRLSPEAGVHSF